MNKKYPYYSGEKRERNSFKYAFENKIKMCETFIFASFSTHFLANCRILAYL